METYLKCNRSNFLSILSYLVLIIFSILAGGSFSGEGFTVIFLTICLVVLSMSIWMLIIKRFNNKQDKARQTLLQSYANNHENIDLCEKFHGNGSLLCYNENEKKITIVAATHEQLNTIDIEDFHKSKIFILDNGYIVVDKYHQRLLVIYTIGLDIQTEIVKFGRVEDCNSEPELNELLTFFSHKNKFILIDRIGGKLITVLLLNNNIVYDITNYLVLESVPKHSVKCEMYNFKDLYIPTGDECRFLTIILDDNAEIFIINKIDKEGRFYQKLIKYEDIISVSYEEDGSTIESKSTTRTVGGALVGGVLFGGAGAIIGGLSGDKKHSRIVKTLSVKILLRSIETPSIVVYTEHIGGVQDYYDLALNQAQRIKDLLSVIIDKIDKLEKDKNNDVAASIADELMKLKALKESGIISESEFMEIKKKLIN